jgi:hypothetical protein
MVKLPASYMGCFHNIKLPKNNPGVLQEQKAVIMVKANFGPIRVAKTKLIAN